MLLRVKEWRKRRGLTQIELAGRAAVDPASLYRIENGLGNPTVHTLEAIAKGLGVEVRDLFPKAHKEAKVTGEKMYVDGIGWVPSEGEPDV